MMKWFLPSRGSPSSQRPGSKPEMTRDRLSFTTYLLIMVAAMLVSGGAYYLRTSYLEADIVLSSALRCVRMLLVYIVLCLGILILRYDYKLEDFGIRKENLAISTVLGIGVYTIALLSFLYHVGDKDFDEHFVEGKRSLDVASLVIVSLFTFCMAAITDIWTRGFVLLPTTRFRSKLVAILLQNVVWFLIHIYEILLLMDAFGLAQSIALTIVLGVTGDMVVLRYRNVLGLAIGHIYLNLVFIIYVVWV